MNQNKTTNGLGLYETNIKRTILSNAEAEEKKL